MSHAGKLNNVISHFYLSLKDPFLQENNVYFHKYQPSGEGGTRSPPAMPHRLQNPKWRPGGPKMADRPKCLPPGFLAF